MRVYLVDLREKTNYSQQFVAEKIGVSRQYYQMIEAGRRQKKMDIILVSKLAQVLGVSMELIIRNEQIVAPQLSDKMDNEIILEILWEGG